MMNQIFSKIKNQDKPKELLYKAFIENRLSHAYLFYGPDGVGKEMMAFELAKAINCQRPDKDIFSTLKDLNKGECNSCKKISLFTHPDVKLIFPTPSPPTSAKELEKYEEELNAMREEKAEKPYISFKFKKATSISVNTIRQIISDVTYKPFEGKKKVYIILDVDKMTVEASNAFLKTLEEPPLDTIFLLTTSRLHYLLPTILSRCQVIKFNRLRADEIEEILKSQFNVSESEAKLFASLSDGSAGKAIEILSTEIRQQRERIFEIYKQTLLQDPSLILKNAEELSADKDRDFIITSLELLKTIIRDILIIIESEDENLIINRDFIKDMKEIAKNYSAESVIESLKIIDEIIDGITRNVMPQLILTTLMIKLARTARKK